MKTTIRYSRLAGGARFGCALAVCALPYVAFADWETTPDLRMEIEANDNPRLGQQPGAIRNSEVDDHTSTRALLDARVRLRNTGPRGELTVQPRVRVDAYADKTDEDLERQDLYLNSRGEYSWRRSTAGLTANIARESIISSELSDSQPIGPDLPIDDPIENDTGLLVFLDEFRERFVLAPYAEFTISERSAILLEARRLDVAYTGPEFRGRTDFDDTELSLGVGRTIDDRTGATARIITSRYRADATNNETDTVGVEGSFSRELNELWSFALTTGLQRSDFTFIDETGEFVDNAATNYTVSIEFAKRTEVSAVDIGLFRLLNPNAVGFLVERNELRVRFTRQLSERLRAGFGIRAMETGALDREPYDRRLFRADFDVEWAFTPSWSFAARYGAVDQKFSGDRIDGTANMLSVGAAYRGLSRPGRQLAN
jgi:hypothetical protein